MFLAGGLAGMLGVYALYRAPEPKSTMVRENLFLLLRKPLQEKNFKKFLIFNSCWAFAVNLVTPFYAVYMMKTLGLPLSYIIILTIAGQLTSISFVRIWGKYADSHSNKTIVQICAPVLIVCIFSWSLISLFSDPVHTGIFLAALHILTGAATSGINLALNNIGLKLAPARESIVYIAARNIVLAFFSAAAPMVGGLLADILSQQNLTFFKFIHLEHWDVFFVIGGIVALFSLRMLKSVYETGEMGKAVLMTDMRRAIVTEFNKNYSRQVMQDKFKGSFNMRSLGIFNMRSLGKNITRRIDNIIVYKRA
jgi:MFS family permease